MLLLLPLFEPRGWISTGPSAWGLEDQRFEYQPLISSEMSCSTRWAAHRDRAAFEPTSAKRRFEEDLSSHSEDYYPIQDGRFAP